MIFVVDIHRVPDLIQWTTSWTRPGTDETYSISLARPSNLDDATLEACYKLIETTSRADYEASTLKWRPAHKREEMRSVNLRYIVVRRAEASGDASKAGAGANPGEDTKAEDGTDKNGNGGAQDGTDTDVVPASDVVAFTSLMPCYEDGYPVVYCYEIHISPTLQGSGLGRILLGFQSIVTHNLGPPVSKVMLTVFLSNESALRFYERQGFSIDESAPVARKLRGGKSFVPDYTILSRKVVREGDEKNKDKDIGKRRR